MTLATRVAILAVVYGALAHLGLRWATALDAASPIWPASGAALAAVLVWGPRVWPGVALGALAAMELSGARTPPPVEIAIALGNSLAPVLVAGALRRFDFDREIRQPRDVVLLVAGGLGYGVVAGLCGTAALLLLGGLPTSAAAEVLLTWATGDAAGVMTAGVLLLAWARREPVSREPGWWAHFAGAVGMTALAGWWLFFAGGARPPMASWQLLPFLAWAALVLDLRAAATATTLAVGLALAGVIGGGTLPDGATETLLTAVQRFTAVCTVTLALMSVLIETERRAKQALAEQDLYRRALESEARLRQSEQTLRLALEGAAMDAFEWDAATDRCVRARDGAAFLGVDIGSTGQAFLDRVHPQDRPAAEAAFQGLSPEAPSASYDYRFRLDADRTVWLRDTIRGEFDDDGRLVRVRGVCADVTARKAADAAHRTSLERLQAAEHAMAAVIYDVRPDGAWRSEGLQRLLGWTPEEIGTTGADGWHAIMHPDDAQRLLETKPPIDAEGRYACEYRVRHKDGRWIWVSDRGQRFTDATGAIRHIGASFDVTERIEAEREARESAARLDLAQAVTRVGTWDWTIRGEGAVVSRTWRQIFGLDPSGAGPVGYEAWLACVHPDDRERAAADVRARLADPSGDELRSEYRALTAEGEVRWIEARGRLYRDAAGTPERLIGVVVDVSERRLAEERQTLLMREIDHRAKNALAVVQAVVRLTKAEDKETFVTAVEGRVQAIARAQTLLSSSRWAGASLRRLVEEEAAPFQSVDGARVLATGPDVLLEPDAAQPAALALHELFTNAAKYGALSVPTGRIEVDWSVDARAGVLRLAWRERGGPPAVEPERKGFGSTVIRSAIESQLRGTLRKAWGPSGLTCDVRIPLREISETALSRPTLRAVSTDGPTRRRVLVVEDEVFIGLDVCEALDALGYEALGPVGRVAEALDLIAAVRPDLAVLDANLAGESSEPVARRLTELRVPFLVCTGYGDFALPGLDAPVLQKPLSADALGEALDVLLRPGSAIGAA